MMRRYRAWRKARRINRLKAKAREQFDALPSRQTRRQAQRRAAKVLGPDALRKGVVPGRGSVPKQSPQRKGD